MVRVRKVYVTILFVLADLALCNIDNGTTNDINKIDDKEAKEEIMSRVNIETRRKDHRSTSSSSEATAEGKSGEDGESLGLSEESSISSSGEDKLKKKHQPKSSEERKGWYKWHRKCTPCPEDMEMKWRDPNIKWICGAYQKARRSFKSLCMMHYRNCQDGTMFVKIHDHRCANDSKREHFHYDYKVKLSDDSSKTDDDDSISEEVKPESDYNY